LTRQITQFGFKKAAGMLLADGAAGRHPLSTTRWLPLHRLLLLVMMLTVCLQPPLLQLAAA
jgi:hypothetical protein